MSLFDKFFGKGKDIPKPSANPLSSPILAKLPPVKNPPAKPATGDPAKDKNLIQVFDSYGREMYITKEQWRTNVLPGSIKSNWNNPDQLYGIIFGALNDGFRSDVVAASEQLYKIDHERARGTCVWGIVLKEEGRLDEAEKVFRDYIAKHGEDGSVLTNLAKIYSSRKNDSKSEEILWHALEVDPNQENGMGWYYAIYRERGGEEAAHESLHRVSKLTGSWRAQLWLAREALQSRDLEKALAYYHESLSRVTKPVPTHLLMQMSGDLGNAGHLPEILKLVEPNFIAEFHGIQVGNNLIKAHVDLAQFDAARRIVDQLYTHKRMDWKQTLAFWDTEIAKARLAVQSVDQKKQLKVTILAIDGPVWLKPSSPAVELFHAKTPNGISICFLNGTAEKATNSQRIEHQLADNAGRLSRSLPLYFAEQVEFNTQARVQTLVPWIIDEVCGFVLAGAAWSDENAAHQARQGQSKSDYVVTTHLKTQAEPWLVELRLVRTIDGKCLGNLNASFSSAKPEGVIPELGRQLIGLLAEHAECEHQASAPLYQVPTGKNFSYYLLRLEQLLAVRCGGMDGVPTNFLSGEREMIDGNIQLCLACPQNVSTRVLLAQTLLTMKKIRADILPEFRDKLVLLQKEKPLQEPAHSVVQRMLNEAMKQ
jgi:tetratricopeptide (TPR) repeat protein